jgi:hypothetical protein
VRGRGRFRDSRLGGLVSTSGGRHERIVPRSRQEGWRTGCREGEPTAEGARGPC